MEEEKASARASSSFAPSAALPAAPSPPLPPSSSIPLAPAPFSQRQMFSVELRSGETTIVSWKKLLRESNKLEAPQDALEAPSGAHPALESRIAPGSAPVAGQTVETELKDAVPPSNRFSAVIEKIERLYMGQQSSDEEELDDKPDEDEYDTEDSFIDDDELNQYFQVDKSATKHNGFFVNRGKLERINEPVALPDHASKKRRRKDLTKSPCEVAGMNKPAKVGNARMKTSGGNASPMGNKSSSSKILTQMNENRHVEKSPLDKLNVTSSSKRKPIDHANKSTMKLQSKDVSFLPMEVTDIEKQKAGAAHSKDHVDKKAMGSSSGMYKAYNDEAAAFQTDIQSKRSSTITNERVASFKIRHKNKNANGELLDLNSSGVKYATHVEKKPSLTPAKDGSGVRSKGTMLERAIWDLEKIVAESWPPSLKVQEADPSFQGIKRRLPREVKQKLAKVARLAQSSQGKISDQLINYLMNIVGHLVQLRTLKRNLKEMVESGLCAKQQKDDKLQQIKKEVIEMIKLRAPYSKLKPAEHQDGPSDDFQQQPNLDGAVKGPYNMDTAMEDKICDLYDLYVEGMDEDKGPQIRKLYVELAELWPNGFMDNNGIKSAVNRAKERRSLYLQNKERVKRKKISPAVRTEEIGKGEGILNPRQEKSATETLPHAYALSDRPFTSLSTNHCFASSERAPSSTPAASGSDHSKNEKLKRSMVNETGEAKDATVVKKKKRKLENVDGGDGHFNSSKLPVLSQPAPGKERPKAQKLLTSPPNTNLRPSALAGFEQPS